MKIKKTILWFGRKIEVYVPDENRVNKLIEDEELDRTKCLWCHIKIKEYKVYGFCCVEHGRLFRAKLKEIENRFYFSAHYSEMKEKFLKEGKDFND